MGSEHTGLFKIRMHGFVSKGVFIGSMIEHVLHSSQLSFNAQQSAVPIRDALILG